MIKETAFKRGYRRGIANQFPYENIGYCEEYLQGWKKAQKERKMLRLLGDNNHPPFITFDDD